MPDFPTRTELFNIFASEVLARASTRPTGRQITPEELFTDGSDVNLIGAGGSAMAEEVVRQLGRCTADLTLDGAVGAALDRWVADRYSTELVRKAASAALVQLNFQRPNADGGAFTYAAGSRVQTEGGIQFELTTGAVFGATDVGPIVANARAVEAGLAGNVAANTITRFITAPDDNSLTVTNPVFASGGDATETDAAFRERARQFFSAQQRGTLAAIEFGALTVPGVRQATAIEALGTNGLVTGQVFLFIADANAQGNQSLVDQVLLALLEFRCGGIIVDVVAATPVFQTITYQLQFETNIDSVLAFDQVRQVTVARVGELAPNETLRRSLLFEAARSVAGVIVPDNAVVVPAGDVVPPAGSGQVIRTRADLVTNT